jgi:hypothetical protein
MVGFQVHRQVVEEGLRYSERQGTPCENKKKSPD